MEHLAESPQSFRSFDGLTGGLQRVDKVAETLQVGNVCGGNGVAEENHEGGEGAVHDDPTFYQEAYRREWGVGKGLPGNIAMPDVAVAFAVSLRVALMCPEGQSGSLNAFVAEDRGAVERARWDGSVDMC